MKLKSGSGLVYLLQHALLSVSSFLLIIYSSALAQPRSADPSEDPLLTEAQREHEILAGRLLIKLKPEASRAVKENGGGTTGLDGIDKINRRHNVLRFEKLIKHGRKNGQYAAALRWYLVEVPSSRDELRHSRREDRLQLRALAQLKTEYESNPDVETAEYDFVVRAFEIPNDPFYASTGSWQQTYSDLWGIRKINPEPAWSISTGSPAIVVADIDTGVDRTHPDLAGASWINDGEIPGNGIDDDQNGYIDDYYGYNFVAGTGDPMDDHGHGTHTVGTIGAIGNNGLGVVGVNWNTRVMALKFLSSSGSGSTYNGIRAIHYAADMGARVASNSWGCNCNSTAMDDAVQYAHDRGMVFVAAAGNATADALDHSPASSDGAITVAASDNNDVQAGFTNWGDKIDVAAPGVDILSLKAGVSPMCTPERTVALNYCRVSGTSMATPHVAGLAALLLSVNPALGVEEVRQIIRTGAVDAGAPGPDKYFGFGRIDAGRSLDIAGSHILAPYITSPRTRTIFNGVSGVDISGSIPGPYFAGYDIAIRRGRSTGTWETISTSYTQVVSEGTLGHFDADRLTDGNYQVRLTAHDTFGRAVQFQVNDLVVDNFETALTSPAVAMTLGNVPIVGTARTKGPMALGGYKLEWGLGKVPAAWSTSGISLVNNGTAPVSSGTLGFWDTSTLTSGQLYTLKLTVWSPGGATDQTASLVTADSDLLPGWPKQLVEAGRGMGGESINPAMADVDGDGSQEIIALDALRTVHVFRKDGSELPGFPATVPNLIPAGSDAAQWFSTPPNVADLDGDGRSEIVAVTRGGTWFPYSTMHIFIIRHDGTLYPGWPIPTSTWEDRTPAIADLDGDGVKELITIDPGTTLLHAYHLDGSELPGFPKSFPVLNPYNGGTLSVADLNGDGHLEIVYGTGNKELYVLDDHGNALPGWPFIAPTVPASSNPPAQLIFDQAPAVSPAVTGAGVVFALATQSGCGGCSAYLVGMNRDGTLLPGWPRDVGRLYLAATYTHAPALVDLNGDGLDEVLIAGTEPTTTTYTGKLSAFTLGGAPLWGGIPSDVSPAVADLDGDGKPEVLAAGRLYPDYTPQIRIVRSDGTALWNRVLTNTMAYYFHDTGVLSDLDGNGETELAVGLVPSQPALHNMLLLLYELPMAGNSGSAWPLFGHDPAHSGNLRGPGPTAIPWPTPEPPQASPTPTPTQTATPRPSATPTATATATPSATQTPTATPTATATPLVPAGPSNLIQSASGPTVKLSWRDNSNNESGFYIERSVKGVKQPLVFETIAATAANVTTYIDTVAKGTYVYRVRAFDAVSGAVSNYSNQVTAKVR